MNFSTTINRITNSQLLNAEIPSSHKFLMTFTIFATIISLYIVVNKSDKNQTTSGFSDIATINATPPYVVAVGYMPGHHISRHKENEQQIAMQAEEESKIPYLLSDQKKDKDQYAIENALRLLMAIVVAVSLGSLVYFFRIIVSML